MRKQPPRRQPNWRPIGFPTQRTVKLRWVNNLSLDSTSGAIATQVIRANDPYAPVINTDQPYMWDMWSGLYDHYVVLGSKITVYASTTGGNAEKPVTYMGVILNDDSNLGAGVDYRTVMEHGAGRWGRLRFSGEGGTKMTSTYSAKKFFNVKDVKDNTDKIGASTAGSPSEFANFIIWTQTGDRATTTVAQMLIVVDYIVQFSEPKDQAPS